MLGRVWLGVCIAAIAGPALAGHVAEYRAGSSGLSVRKLPPHGYSAVTLNRGVTADSGLAAWASQVGKHRPKHKR